MRILINASTSIGDSFYFAFMIDNIYRHYPEASLQILCWHPMVSFYKSFPYVEQVIPYNRVEKDNAFALFLIRPHVDMYIDLQHTLDSAQLARAIGATQRIGVNPYHLAKDYYTFCIVPKTGEHIKDAFIRGFSEYWPDKDIDHTLRIRITKDHFHRAARLLIDYGILPGDAYVIVHPGAKGKEKLWSNDRWCEVVTYFYEKGIKVVLIGTCLKEWGGAPIFDEVNCNDIYEKRAHQCVNLVGQTDDMMLLAALIKKASMYCGLDTGPTHLAALLDVPIVQVYKYTDQNTFSLWRPYAEEVAVFKADDTNELLAKEVIKACNVEAFVIE